MAVSEIFKQQLQDALAAINIGQTFTFRRTFTEGDVSTFCGITGDYNPYHIDEPFAQQSFYGRRIIPGLLTASMITHIGGLLGFLATEMHFNYLSAVYVGDTVECVVTITEKQDRRVSATAKLTNQAGKLVLEAAFSGFPSNVRLAR